ncbi:zinc finger protein 37-like [Contarinia nasturtii]|uniref:zinc finger protein 37-like n=1 Tax=Contarinia nasturtii TaxID=265458 RepID=UPI0012D3C63B|nr:zinc finger protein 37-like [Contarinia nasturtii]
MNPYRSSRTLGGKSKKHKCKRNKKIPSIKIKEEVDVKPEPSDGTYLIQQMPSSPQATPNGVIKSESESDIEIDLESKPNYVKKEIKSEDELKSDMAKDGNEMVNDDQIGESSSATKRNSNKKQRKEGRSKRKKSKGSKNDRMAKPSKKPSVKHGKKHKCTFCNYVTSQKGHLTRHIRTHTGEKPFACEIYAKAFAQKHNLNRHKKTHAAEFQFCCSKCRQAHEIDKMNHEGKCKHRQYACHLCKNAAHHLQHLKQHMQIHNGERSFRCRVCAKTFLRKDDLNNHSRTHIKELPFDCAQCGRRFADENEKQSHEDHCKGRRYVCYLCPFKCFQKYDLRRHMQVHHTGERGFKCGVCGKKCLHKGHLKQHLATHSKRKPVHCSKCLMPFANVDDMIAHKDRCKRRLYQCYLCKVLKNQSTQLQGHMRNYHTGEKPFPCKLCDGRFSLLGQANLHMKKVHGSKK